MFYHFKEQCHNNEPQRLDRTRTYSVIYMDNEDL
jgi:hypothetical protein